MTQFLLCEKDLNDNTRFNQELLRRKFIKLSKICHPDRPQGDKEVFMQLKINYGLLLGLLEDRKKGSKVDEKSSSSKHDMKQIEYKKTTNIVQN